MKGVIFYNLNKQNLPRANKAANFQRLATEQTDFVATSSLWIKTEQSESKVGKKNFVIHHRQ